MANVRLEVMIYDYKNNFSQKKKNTEYGNSGMIIAMYVSWIHLEY